MAFLCAEYGVHVSLPVYSGGLGALAGDLLKEASDCALPMVAVGLMYRRGYFRQRIDAGGWQHEYWVDTDPQRLPAALVTGTDGEPLTVEVPIHDVDVTAQIWRVDVGRVPLFLLDTDVPGNDPLERWITAACTRPTRASASRSTSCSGPAACARSARSGSSPASIHLNEGHAALAPLAARGPGAADSGEKLADGSQRRASGRCSPPTPRCRRATTPTPPSRSRRHSDALTGQLGVAADEVLALGRTHPEDESEPFGVTQAALRMSRAANGVSRRHGEVAREMWHALWPEARSTDVPVGHVTNGVHVPTWIGAPMRELLDRHLGEGWMARAADPDTWAGVDEIPDAELWEARRRQRATLVDEVRSRSTTERLLRGDAREYVVRPPRRSTPTCSRSASRGAWPPTSASTS